MITETLNNCDADTMTDGMGTLNVCATSSQTESLMTSFYYEFESMSTHEQTSLIQTIFANSFINVLLHYFFRSMSYLRILSVSGCISVVVLLLTS